MNHNQPSEPRYHYSGPASQESPLEVRQALVSGYKKQAVRKLSKDDLVGTSLGSHDPNAIKHDDRVAHRGWIVEAWQMYQYQVRSNFDMFLKVWVIAD